MLGSGLTGIYKWVSSSVGFYIQALPQSVHTYKTKSLNKQYKWTKSCCPVLGGDPYSSGASIVVWPLCAVSHSAHHFPLLAAASSQFTLLLLFPLGFISSQGATPLSATSPHSCSYSTGLSALLKGKDQRCRGHENPRVLPPLGKRAVTWNS